jgi:hypothetical protein
MESGRLEKLCQSRNRCPLLDMIAQVLQAAIITGISEGRFKYVVELSHMALKVGG